MMGLTPRLKSALDFIRSHYQSNGLMPSCDQIAAGIGLTSRGRVSQLLTELEDRGHIRRVKGKSRSIELIEPGQMQAVMLNKEILGLLKVYAQAEHIGVDAAANELLRGALGAA